MSADPETTATAAPERTTPDPHRQVVGPDGLSPEARFFADLMTASVPPLGREVTDAAEARRLLAANPKPDVPPLEVGSVENRTIPGPEGAPDLPVRIYLPDPREVTGPRPTVVFFHGGGWTICDLDSHDATARALCRGAGAAVVSVDYRLAPEHPFPAAVDDASAAFAWATEHVAELGGDPEALVVCGDSAGGNIAAVTAHAARDRGLPLALQALIYPITDVSRPWASYDRYATGYFLTAASMHWFTRQYVAPGSDPADPRVSPLRGELAGLAPAHVVTAGCDPLADEGEAYARALDEAGVPVARSHFPRMFHGFFGLAEHLDDARTALAGVTEAIAATVSDRKNSGDHGGAAG
ncbi:alpha/beta hydrolase fold domain-containing protein [Streptomyces sp. NPDC050418]|uniref:alpha/beta hydrolase fold domain-containing protein n=1 Tax=Streptomyces sp. NPDC050418 TaxID=3365612 RepID=UPI00379B711B